MRCLKQYFGSRYSDKFFLFSFKSDRIKVLQKLFRFQTEIIKLIDQKCISQVCLEQNLIEC